MKAVVLGSMNCMPTEYAILLKKYFSEVVHYYDAGKGDALSNPTIRWGSNSSERTKGIILKKIFFRHYLFFIWSKLFHGKMLNDLNTADLILLSGPSISLARFIRNKKKQVVAISYGTDISLYCNPLWPTMNLSRLLGKKDVLIKILKYPKMLFSKYQILGLKSCTHYSYFIPGFDLETDSILDKMFSNSTAPIRLPRYSIGLDVFEIVSNENPISHLDDYYKILFPVRFSDNELLGNKGWHVLFDAIKKYKLLNRKKFKLVCFKKGSYLNAQACSRELEIDDVIEWHDVVPFSCLIQYYRSADVVVEQLGTHWIAQGLFAMALGKPVIGRAATEAQFRFFFDSGLLLVENASSLVEKLIYCESMASRVEVGNISRTFVLEKASINSEFNGWGLI